MITNRLLLTSVHRFEAAHRLYSQHLSQAENERIYGKCARPGGHGHNYEVEVSLQGELPESQSLLIDRESMQEKVRTLLIDRVDHRNLDDLLGDVVSTGENLARAFFGWLAPAFSGDVFLYRVRVRETRNNMFEVIRPESR